MIRKQIQYIKKRMRVLKCEELEIMTGKLTQNQISAFKKHFIISQGYMGYTTFKIKNHE